MCFSGNRTRGFRIPNDDVRIGTNRNDTFPGIQVEDLSCGCACYRDESASIHFPSVLDRYNDDKDLISLLKQYLSRINELKQFVIFKSL